MMNVIFLVIITIGFVAGRNPSFDVLEIVKRIEEQLNKEDRLREITDIVRIDSTLDKLGKKLDRVLLTLESSRSSPGFGRSNSFSTVVGTVDKDVTGKLEDIDERLSRLESLMERMDEVLGNADLQKLNDLDVKSSELKEDLNKKLRKMMNIITAVYEMNKEMKSNMGGRSEVMSHPEKETAKPNYATEFLIENLEELERKIKEQFSVLSTEIRTEITGLKIMASSVGNGCDKSITSDFDYDDLTPESNHGQNQRRLSRKDDTSRKEPNPPRTLDNNSLENLVQSLGRTTREIKEEIQQGIQAIDLKLSNLTNLPLRCEDPMDASDSIVQPVRVSRDYDNQQPEQSLDEKIDRKKEGCTKVVKNVASPKSCAELRKGGANCDGVYIIFLNNVRAVRVLCDMTTEGGGWTVLMRRGEFGDEMTSFHRNWLSYKNGFGDMEGEFWLGNDALHLLTTQDENILRIHLEAFDGEDVNLTYSNFVVYDELDSYRMNLGPAVGRPTPASNSLKYHNNHPFSTFDKKNDVFPQNCAATYKGGWWFNGCYFGFLTGEYFRPQESRENWQGILWYDWKGHASLKGGLMMIRPKNFTSY